MTHSQLTKIRDYFKPYYLENDKSHDISHADSVCTLALTINDITNNNVNEIEIVISAYAHDMFSGSNRKDHHIHAFLWVVTKLSTISDKILDNHTLDIDVINRIARATLEHRASFKGEFYSSLSEIISSADRGHPKLSDVILRAYEFSGDVNDTYNHIVDKFGHGGYANYPKLYSDVFQNELNSMKDEISTDLYKQIIAIANR